jgi:hypothetical protein
MQAGEAVPSSPILVTLMMESRRPSETSDLKRDRRRNIPEDGVLHSQRRGKLKSYIALNGRALTRFTRRNIPEDGILHTVTCSAEYRNDGTVVRTEERNDSTRRLSAIRCSRSNTWKFIGSRFVEEHVHGKARAKGTDLVEVWASFAVPQQLLKLRSSRKSTFRVEYEDRLCDLAVRVAGC